MQMKLYALKDLKVGTFSQVMMAQNDGHLSRNLQEGLTGQETQAKFPGDFEVWQVAEYDWNTGGVEPSLRFVCSLSVILSKGEGHA